MSENYQLTDGIYTSPTSVIHRDDEYDPRGYEMLGKMQSRHFWYLGRHRFLLHAVHRYAAGMNAPRVVDLGGGCGGWISYLAKRMRFRPAELALADSSIDALKIASRDLPADAKRYQIDLLDLQWHDRWDMAFLLDVLEHIPQHEDALRQIHQALAPGGMLFVTTPALQQFWTWNDDVNRHVRRYCRADYRHLAEVCGYRLVDARYFMFLLSPLLVGSRLLTRGHVKDRSHDEGWAMLEKMHRVPNPVVNGPLRLVFSLETPLGHYIPFPWGTSILAILQKPASR